MSDHQARNILVTGAAGFIGSNFTRMLARQHNGRLLLLDALTYAGNMENLQEILTLPHVRFVHGDIGDDELLTRVFRDGEIDTVVHLAAESHVDRSIAGPDAFIRTNVQGTHALLKAAREAWGTQDSRRFHHVSTDEVYGSIAPGAPPADEKTAYAPNSPYAASKAAADHLVRAYHQTYGLPVVTTNCSNNFGPWQFPEKLVSLAIVRAFDGASIPVYGDGGQIRDWLYVTDHCVALDAVLHRGAVGETYNIAGTGGLTNLQVLDLLCAAVDRLLTTDTAVAERFPDAPAARGGRSADLLTSVPDRPGHDRRYALDDSRLRDRLGVKPSVGLERGLELTVRWYADNEGWWRRVMDGSYQRWISNQYQSLAATS